MGLRGYSKGDFAKGFEQELLRARKKAGRKIGRQVLRERKKALGKASQRRKAAVRSTVFRDGTLLVADHAPMAWAQEEGETIRPEGAGKLLVRVDQDFKRGEKAFKSGDGKYLFAADGKRTRLVGVYKNSVRIPQLPASKRMAKIATSKLGEYADLIDKELYS